MATGKLLFNCPRANLPSLGAPLPSRRVIRRKVFSVAEGRPDPEVETGLSKNGYSDQKWDSTHSGMRTAEHKSPLKNGSFLAEKPRISGATTDFNKKG